jgi:hypothetical protein
MQTGPKKKKKKNIPLLQALLVDGPQFMIHNAWLVTLKTDILQKTGKTASLSPPLQDTQQKNN